MKEEVDTPSRQPKGARGGRLPKTAEEATARFDRLPESAGVPKKTGCEVLSMSSSAFDRLAKVDPRLKPVRLNARTIRYPVGGIRSILRGEGVPK